MSTPSDTFTQMVVSTLRHRSGQVADNVSEHNALLNVMKRKSKIKSYDGGREIVVELEYAENGTFQRYAGYDALNTQASNTLTAAKYDWKQSAIHVTASGREIRLNSGENQMINLVKQRTENAKRTAANNMSIDIYSDGSLSNQIGGLGNLIQTAGTGTVGGIDSSTWTFWQNKVKEMTGTNTAASPSAANSLQMVADMNALWLSLNRGTDKPDLIVMTHDLYALYELGLQDKQRYQDADLAEAGFDNIKYKSAPVVFDDNTNFSTTGEKAYFLNCDYLWMFQHPEAKWTPEDRKTPTNQDAVVVPMYWMGNMAVSNRSLQGVLFDAA